MLNYSKLTRELRAHHYIIQNKCYNTKIIKNKARKTAILVDLRAFSF